MVHMLIVGLGIIVVNIAICLIKKIYVFSCNQLSKHSVEYNVHLYEKYPHIFRAYNELINTMRDLGSESDAKKLEVMVNIWANNKLARDEFNGLVKRMCSNHKITLCEGAILAFSVQLNKSGTSFNICERISEKLANKEFDRFGQVFEGA